MQKEFRIYFKKFSKNFRNFCNKFLKYFQKILKNFPKNLKIYPRKFKIFHKISKLLIYFNFFPKNFPNKFSKQEFFHIFSRKNFIFQKNFKFYQYEFLKNSKTFSKFKNLSKHFWKFLQRIPYFLKKISNLFQEISQNSSKKKSQNFSIKYSKIILKISITFQNFS